MDTIALAASAGGLNSTWGSMRDAITRLSGKKPAALIKVAVSMTSGSTFASLTINHAP